MRGAIVSFVLFASIYVVMSHRWSQMNLIVGDVMYRRWMGANPLILSVRGAVSNNRPNRDPLNNRDT